jgi:hypothetical protein
MKTSSIILASVGAIAAGAVLYVALKRPEHPDDADPATRNPWRGTGSSCEVDFDGRPAADKAKIVALVNAAAAKTLSAARAIASCDVEAYRTIAASVVPAPTLPSADHSDDLDPLTKNPWRGTSLPCESEFDAMPTLQKRATVSLLAATKTQNVAAYAALMKCEKQV